MGRLRELALALALVLAGVGGAWAQEPGDLPDLEDITIDVVTDFDRLGPGPDIGALDREDDGDVHIIRPGDGSHHDGELGDHDDGEVGDHHETETEDHETEVGDDVGGDVGGDLGGDPGGFDEETDGIGDGHDDD